MLRFRNMGNCIFTIPWISTSALRTALRYRESGVHLRNVSSVTDKRIKEDTGRIFYAPKLWIGRCEVSALIGVPKICTEFRRFASDKRKKKGDKRKKKGPKVVEDIDQKSDPDESPDAKNFFKLLSLIDNGREILISAFKKEYVRAANKEWDGSVDISGFGSPKISHTLADDEYCLFNSGNLNAFTIQMLIKCCKSLNINLKYEAFEKLSDIERNLYEMKTFKEVTEKYRDLYMEITSILLEVDMSMQLAEKIKSKQLQAQGKNFESLMEKSK